LLFVYSDLDWGSMAFYEDASSSFLSVDAEPSKRKKKKKKPKRKNIEKKTKKLIRTNSTILQNKKNNMG
jgi:hypothetical protein